MCIRDSTGCDADAARSASLRNRTGHAGDMTSGSSARVTAWDLAERATCRDRVNELHAADDERQWEELGFTDGERDVWVSSGMPRRLAHVARARVDHGIAPSDLQRPVGAMTVVELLEAGEAPAAVSAQLWRARRAQRA